MNAKKDAGDFEQEVNSKVKLQTPMQVLIEILISFLVFTELMIIYVHV